MSAQIEKGIPVPAQLTRGRRTGVRPILRDLHAADSGDSVLISDALFQPTASQRSQLSSITDAARHIAEPGWYRVARVEGGHRVWKL